jgi:hypothetical protein
MSDYISLYDYLGFAAGSPLGKQVAEVASTKNIPIQRRFVSNTKYTGEVMLYPPEFLDEYFRAEQSDEMDIDELNTLLMEDSFKQNN